MARSSRNMSESHGISSSKAFQTQLLIHFRSTVDPQRNKSIEFDPQLHRQSVWYAGWDRGRGILAPLEWWDFCHTLAYVEMAHQYGPFSSMIYNDLPVLFCIVDPIRVIFHSYVKLSEGKTKFRRNMEGMIWL